MKWKRKYKIERAQPGVLTYREGGTQFRFPIYDEDGEVVFVAWPTSQHIFLYFLSGGWARVPRQFSKPDRERITAHVIEHFRRDGVPVRVLTKPNEDEQSLQFHPELFDYKGRASGVLDTAGFAWFSDYSSIDLLHDEFGLEVCGIQEESSLEPIANAMRREFPQWHYNHICCKDCGRDPGWKFALHMFPRRCGGGRSVGAD